MPTSRVMNSVLPNFLGTFTSRYSEFRGYWLFGFLVRDLREIEIDLLATSESDPERAADVAIATARSRFREQVVKAGLSVSRIEAARLTMCKLPGESEAPVNGRICRGYHVKFVAEASTHGTTLYRAERAVFVAPHDPAVEQRSAA